ncbi:MAG: transcription elongation factor NusA, partial [Nitrosopumilales archaeon CG15_BIG_FIL_POST_REV_8_21_14_020_33_23]
MKLPICNFDAKNTVLCPKCESNVEAGIITKADADASIILAKLARSNSIIDKFSLYSCKEFNGNYVLSLAKNDIMAI